MGKRTEKKTDLLLPLNEARVETNLTNLNEHDGDVNVTQVLITKLRSANTAETRQYRKASKALLVLLPLLGITYLVVLAGPTEGGVGSSIFAVTRAVLLSTQASTRASSIIL